MKEQSVWLATAEFPAFPPAAGDLSADVVVIGGGLVGLTTALLAARDGADVVVVEAAGVGSRTSGHTTGKVTSQHTVIYDELIRRHGRDKARQYADANQAGVERVAALAGELGIDCELVRTPAYVYSNDESHRDLLTREATAAADLGLPARLADSGEIGLPAVIGVAFDHQVQFHAGRYLAGLAAELTRLGVRIFEHSRVTDVDESEDRAKVTTAAGAVVRAGHVVMATQLPLGATGGYFARATASRSYGIAVRLDRPAPTGMAITVESPTLSTRPWPEAGPNGLIVVGGDHEVAKVDDTETRYQILTDWVSATWNVGIDAIEYRWSAQDYSTPDRVPYVGRSPGSRAILVATGMHKWGLSNGTAAAILLSDVIAGRDNPWADVFDARRIGGARAVADIVKENLKVGKDFATGHLGRIVKGGTDHLEVGQGGLLDVNGRTIGAYRDLEGRLHAVKPVCTHMGCALDWNTADRSWDCPCHGSRFDPDGAVIEGPAVKPLPSEDAEVG